MRHERRRSHRATLARGSSARPQSASLPPASPMPTRRGQQSGGGGRHREGANKGDLTEFLVLRVVRRVLHTASRMPTTAACRAVMTSQGTASRSPAAAFLSSRDVAQPFKTGLASHTLRGRGGGILSPIRCTAKTLTTAAFPSQVHRPCIYDLVPSQSQERKQHGLLRQIPVSAACQGG